MGSYRCLVVFDNPLKTYHPGEQVTGKVELNFSTVTKLKGVSITFKGEAHTSWKERNHSRGAYNRYSARELYFRQIHCLQKGENAVTFAGKSFAMPRGKTTYIFSLTLPPSLPSSFEGQHGHIRYTARVTLDTTGFLNLNENYKTAFTVVAPLDLNSTPNLKNPIRRGAEETVSFMCCVNGTVTLTGYVPMGGYVPGQQLPVTIECKNESDSTVTCLRTSLDEYTEFKAKSLMTSRRKTSKRRIKCELGGFVKPRSSRSIQQMLDIPSLSPSNLSGCTIIYVSYALKICATVSGLFGDLKVKIPIVIGTVPIIQNLITDGVPPDYASYAPSISAFSDIPPPSYEECMFGKSLNEGEKDDDDTELTVGDTDSFVPRYPVYKFGPSAPPLSTL